MRLPQLVTTSVVRGSVQGESHGGVFLVDLSSGRVDQVVDWNTCDIDFTGRGADRGLRGIAIAENEIYIAASDELFAFDLNFNVIQSYRIPYLKHCHEIDIYNGNIYLTSTGFDSVLIFNLAKKTFVWGIQFYFNPNHDLEALSFDPAGLGGPVPKNELHLNSVVCTPTGFFASGVRLPNLIHFTNNGIQLASPIPMGTHNVKPHGKGLILNDTQRNQVIYATENKVSSIKVPSYRSNEILNENLYGSKVARQQFARGLCSYNEQYIVGGSSPSTVTLYDLKESRAIKSINLSMDIRNAIHGLELWPF